MKLTARQAAARRHLLMAKLMSTAQGRARLASSFTEPLRTYRDYLAIGRKMLFVDELPDGTTPVYDMDPELPAFLVGERADNIEIRADSDRLLVPLYELASNPTIPFVQVKERRYDVTKRVREKARLELFRREDRLIFSAMDLAAKDAKNTVITGAKADLTFEHIVDLFTVVEGRDLRVDKVVLNPSMASIVRKAGRDYFAFETQAEILRTGFIGTIFGAQVYQSVEVPKDTMYAVAEPDYVGVMPIRIDLTVIPADEPKERVFGWSMFSNQGTGIHNLKGVAAMVGTA